ncbi:hypothetical protein AX774_g506 [Zancudomyces culisetae]|uniref:Arrestin-like N-terminal domain-containing protein n=1 Tax=Zancudomyces culisetae TaxID=1213189 RepID=A0A1R1PY85_ZANCU|nr:hypothetical protein AX774_g1524 [Zancudomyces culisetae]OMH85925.1 hypothetical protein AX774_g506 [Zancudomyces culisetae]|eukprot:OMH84934.1 hypothetical protein AX774_g1524 [Zancudomyces culisetae]
MDFLFKVRFPVYSSEVPVCNPGTSLAGVVIVQNDMKLRIANITLSFRGNEKVVMALKTGEVDDEEHPGASMMGGSGGYEPNRSSREHKQPSRIRKTQPKNVRAIKKEYFNKRILISGKWDDEDEATTLNPGTHIFHFTSKFPKVNYPESAKTAEYNVSYYFEAELRYPRGSGLPSLIRSAPIRFVPRVIVDFPNTTEYASYKFCDLATLVEEKKSKKSSEKAKTRFHVEAQLEKRAFKIGDNVDLKLKVVGPKRLIGGSASIIENTEACYPFAPLDMTGGKGKYNCNRIWSKNEMLVMPSELVFDSKNIPYSECKKHNLSHSASNKVFVVNTRLGPIPNSISPLSETYYMRFTYYVLVLLTYSSGLSGSKVVSVKIPLPVVTETTELRSGSSNKVSASCTSTTGASSKKGLFLSSANGGTRDKNNSPTGTLKSKDDARKEKLSINATKNFAHNISQHGDLFQNSAFSLGVSQAVSNYDIKQNMPRNFSLININYIDNNRSLQANIDNAVGYIGDSSTDILPLSQFSSTFLDILDDFNSYNGMKLESLDPEERTTLSTRNHIDELIPYVFSVLPLKLVDQNNTKFSIDHLQSEIRKIKSLTKKGNTVDNDNISTLTLVSESSADMALLMDMYGPQLEAIMASFKDLNTGEITTTSFSTFTSY